jgi:hypothetical protein
MVRESILPDLQGAGYRGPFGIDTMIYRGRDSSLLFYPLLEMNLRFTMGAIALELHRHSHTKRLGRLELFSVKDIMAGGERVDGFVARKEMESPLQYHDKDTRRIESGFLALNDPLTVRTVLASWAVQ